MPTPEEMTIPDKLDSINIAKQAIRSAIVSKGVEVPEGTTFYEYAGLIDGIETGGKAISVQIALNSGGSFVACYVDENGTPQKISTGSTITIKEDTLLSFISVGSTTTVNVNTDEYKYSTSGSNNFGLGKTGAFVLVDGALVSVTSSR